MTPSKSQILETLYNILYRHEYPCCAVGMKLRTVLVKATLQHIKLNFISDGVEHEFYQRMMSAPPVTLTSFEYMYSVFFDWEMYKLWNRGNSIIESVSDAVQAIKDSVERPYQVVAIAGTYEQLGKTA